MGRDTRSRKKGVYQPGSGMWHKSGDRVSGISSHCEVSTNWFESKGLVGCHQEKQEKNKAMKECNGLLVSAQVSKIW